MPHHGVPDRSTFLRLLYNEPSECLVASVARELEIGGYVEELYYRHKTASEYVRVAATSDTALLHDPVWCSDAPRVYFLVLVGTGTEGGLDYESISFVELPSGHVQIAVSSDALIVPSGYSRVWPSSLIAVLPGESGIIGRFAFERPTGEFTAVVDYWLCQLHTPDLRFVKISQLPDVFA
jgi:hypothetical protein